MPLLLPVIPHVTPSPCGLCLLSRHLGDGKIGRKEKRGNVQKPLLMFVGGQASLKEVFIQFLLTV